jgi:hypothetical protein
MFCPNRNPQKNGGGGGGSRGTRAFDGHFFLSLPWELQPMMMVWLWSFVVEHAGPSPENVPKNSKVVFPLEFTLEFDCDQNYQSKTGG